MRAPLRLLSRRALRLIVPALAALAGTAAAAPSYCTAIYATANPSTDSGGKSRHLFLNTVSGTTAAYDLINDTPVGTGTAYQYNASSINPVDGQLYYVERTTGTLLKYNPVTRQTTRVGQSPDLINNNNTFGSLVGSAIEETGRMYVYHSYGLVSVFRTSDGGVISRPAPVTFPPSFVKSTTTNGDIVLGAGNQLYIIVEGSLNGGAVGSHLVAINDQLVADPARIVPIRVGGTPLTAVNGLAIEPFRTLPDGTTIVGETFYLSTSSAVYAMTPDGQATNIESGNQGIVDLASCNVIPDRPTLSKVFEPPFVSAAGGTSRLTITVGNNNRGPIALYTDLVDRLPSTPAQMTFAATPNISGTCDNSRIVLNNTTPPELRFLAGSYIPVGGCTLQVNVTVPQPGTYRNTIVGSTVITSADVVQESATATLYTALGVTKTFDPPLRLPGQTTTLTVTLTNPNSADTTSLNFEDRVAETTGVTGLTLGSVQSNSCGGTVGTAGGVLSVGGTTLRAGASCSVRLPVTLPASLPGGTYTNTILPTQVSATFNDGVRTSTVYGAQTATASVTVTPFALVSSALRTTQSPSTVTNPHRLTPGVTGPVTFSLTRPPGARFQYLLWHDVNGDGQVDPGDAAIIPAGQTTGTLTVTDAFPKRPDGTPADVNLLVQVLVPPGLAQGLTETVTLAAQQTTGGATRTASLTDTTVIGQSGGEGGSLTLVKFVRNVTAGGPFSLNASTGGVNEQLEYCINYLNQGTGTLSEVVITDPIPFFTQPLGDGYGPGQGVRLVRGASVQAGQTTTPGTDASNLSSAADTDAGTLSSNRLSVTVGTLGGGEQGAACYRVQIR
jgi:hypothetical protein